MKPIFAQMIVPNLSFHDTKALQNEGNHVQAISKLPKNVQHTPRNPNKCLMFSKKSTFTFQYDKDASCGSHQVFHHISSIDHKEIEQTVINNELEEPTKHGSHFIILGGNVGRILKNQKIGAQARKPVNFLSQNI